MSGSPVYVILGEHGGVSGMPGGKRMRKEREELEDLRDELEKLMDGRNYVGCAPEQTASFLKKEVAPVLEKYQDLLENEGEEIRV